MRPDLSHLAAIDAFRRYTASTTRGYLERASAAELNMLSSDTINPNPGQPPDWIDRSNHLRACALSPRTSYQLPRP